MVGTLNDDGSVTVVVDGAEVGPWTRPSCDDGFQNQGEQGGTFTADCGGPCDPCPDFTGAWWCHVTQENKEVVLDSLQPGDAVVHHCQIVHRAEENTADISSGLMRRAFGVVFKGVSARIDEVA